MKYKLKNTYKTISQVVEILNTNSKKKSNNQTHTLRYWEKQFKQIKPIKINNLFSNNCILSLSPFYKPYICDTNTNLKPSQPLFTKPRCFEIFQT